MDSITKFFMSNPDAVMFGLSLAWSIASTGIAVVKTYGFDLKKMHEAYTELGITLIDAELSKEEKRKKAVDYLWAICPQKIKALPFVNRELMGMLADRWYKETVKPVAKKIRERQDEPPIVVKPPTPAQNQALAGAFDFGDTSTHTLPGNF